MSVHQYHFEISPPLLACLGVWEGQLHERETVFDVDWTASAGATS